MTQYVLTTPWRWETWGAKGEMDPYSRLAGRPITGGTIDGTINPFLTDIPRGYSLLITGTSVAEIQTPSQDQLNDCDSFYLGGHTYTVDQATATILTNAGYGDYLEPIV